MKHYIIVILLLKIAISANAQNQPQIDTIYYDKNWKAIPAKQFADYYSIVLMPDSDSTLIKCRNYYVSGELHSECDCTYFDKSDHKKTIWDGAGTVYYKNGTIAKHCIYKNGVLNGKYIEFDKENCKCKSIEYADGKPQNDYYEIFEQNGSYGKFRISDNKLIWEQPTILDKKEFFSRGERIQYYENNGLTIAVSLQAVRDYGKYYKLSIIINNKSYETVNFDINRIYSSITDYNTNIIPVPVLMSFEYEKKIRHRQNALRALYAIGEYANARQAGYSASHTNIQSTYGGHSHYAGGGAVVGSGGYAVGGYAGGSSYIGGSNTNISTYSYNGLAAYQASIIAGERIASFGREQLEERIEKIQNYAESETLFPGNSLSGYFLVKYRAGAYLSINVVINGIKYKFYWSI